MIRASRLAASQEVRLEVATPADATLLSNLLELYIHDLSEAFPLIELGPDGRFGYERLPLYWSEPRISSRVFSPSASGTVG